jgi:hypothetical protein
MLFWKHVRIRVVKLKQSIATSELYFVLRKAKNGRVLMEVHYEVRIQRRSAYNNPEEAEKEELDTHRDV